MNEKDFDIENDENEGEENAKENISDADESKDITDDAELPRDDDDTDEFDPFEGPSDAYELEYDTKSEKYTAFPTNDESKSHQGEGAKNETQKRSRAPHIISIISLATALITSLLLVFCLFEISSLKSSVNNGSPSVGGPVSGAPESDYSGGIPVTNLTDIWVNPDVIDYNDAVANAVAKTIGSAVIIEGFIGEDEDALGSASSAGSGVLFARGEGCTFVATCNHVIESMSTVRVTLNNGDAYWAEVVGTDVQTDLAVLKIAATGLPTVTLPSEDSTLLLGQAVIAIGNPLGILSNSVTSGVISALTRNVTIEGVKMQLLQMDASVNSGNSGGGLFDINGQLIGIVNAKSASYSVEGIGFAIPFKTVRSICTELIEKGFVSGRPAIGIGVATVTAQNYSGVFSTYPDLKAFATEKTSGFFGTQTRIIEGIYITDTSGIAGYAEGSEKLAFGDRITLVAGETVSSLASIRSVIYGYSAGDTIEITVTRGGKSVVVQLILGQAK